MQRAWALKLEQDSWEGNSNFHDFASRDRGQKANSFFGLLHFFL